MGLNRLQNLVMLKMSFSYLLYVVLVLVAYQAYGSSHALSVAAEVREDEMRRLPGLCASSVTIHGYKCNEFEVRTDDGYILSVQRVPGRGGRLKKPPVLLQHGIMVDGMTWILNPPDQALAFILADNGFDVWISNTRGTQFSRRHVTLDARQAEYWNWSWDELVSYDFPAVTEFVFRQTGQEIHYVGHSLGTLVPLASFAQGKLNRIRSAVLLSPIAYLTHMTTIIGIVGARAFLGELATVFGLAEFFPKGKAATEFLQALCATTGVNCYDNMSAFTGKNCCLNASLVHTFLKYEPQSTSTRNLIHLSQTYRNGVLSMYDYGSPNINMQHYGESRPPVYDLTKIPRHLPLFLSYGGLDALSDVKDVQTLLDILKLHDVGKLHVQYIKDYAHIDFIMAANAKDLVYNQILTFFHNFT